MNKEKKMLSDFNKARKAGLSVESAVRWAKYAELYSGNPLITVEQKQAPRAAGSVGLTQPG